MGNPNIEVQRFGQSFWYDNIQRSVLASGELKELVEDYGVLGLTSNPSIFDKAISQSADYDDDIRLHARAGLGAKAIYEQLAIADIRAAADVLEPVFEHTHGRDGFVSLEVSPELARDPRGTVEEARRLFKAVGRKNLMIKVPATPECLPAIEQLISEGINVNVTLIFSLDGYEQVARAFIAGLQARAAQGKSLDVASVASFFVSRVDTLVDGLLNERIAAENDATARAELTALKHKAAIANAKLAYRIFRRILAEPGWQTLQRRGARPQRLLWASTSTKNPSLPDTHYPAALIGADTVDTLPPATLKAFRERGVAAATLEEGADEAERTLKRLEAHGVNMAAAWQKLQDDGVALFSDAFTSLLASVDLKRASILARGEVTGKDFAVAEGYVEELAAMRTATRMWQRDASVWTKEPEHIKTVVNRLGWLSSLEFMREALPDLMSYVESVKAMRLTDAVVLGMGGSSLAPAVLRALFGESQPGQADLRLHVLDTIEPGTVKRFSDALDVRKTLFVVASKSGGTIEVSSLYEFFRAQADEKILEDAGRHFVAITDESTKLQSMAASEMFGRVFINPSDIGGRFSALSYFGLLPAALMGLDVAALLARAERMANWCKIDSTANPGLWLGALLGGMALAGRDKVTLLVSPPIKALGAWLEQLIAESTGKVGRGIVPVEDDAESLKPLSDVSEDRVFVHLRLAGDETHEKLVGQIKKLGKPLIELELRDLYDVAAEFFRWEFATAVAGAVLGVNPFDEPNVTESKINTKRLLEEHEDSGVFSGESSSKSANSQINKFLRSAKHGDYVAIQAYLPDHGEAAEQLDKFRQLVADKTGVPVTLGFGPRFLHSTGQLHKGGGNNVVAVQLTCDTEEDQAIPGAPYTFGTLLRAQALGDFESLRAHGRRVIRMHLGYDAVAGLKKLMRTMKGATRKRPAPRPSGDGASRAAAVRASRARSLQKEAG